MENLSFDQLPSAVSQLTKKLENIEKLLFEQRELQPADDSDQLLTIQEAAEFLRLAVPTLYTLVSKGQLPVMKKGKRLYFSRKELHDWIKEGRRKTMGEIDQEAQSYILKKEFPYAK